MSFPRKTPLSTSIRGRAEPYTRDRWSQYRSSQDNDKSASILSGLPRPRGSDTSGQVDQDTKQAGPGRRDSTIAQPQPRVPSFNSSRDSSNTRRNPFMRRRQSGISRRATGEVDADRSNDRRRDSKAMPETIADQSSRPTTLDPSDLLLLPQPDDKAKSIQGLEPRLSNVPSDASYNTVRRPSDSSPPYEKLPSSSSDVKPLTWKSFDKGIDIDSRGAYGRRGSKHFGFPGAKAEKPAVPNLPLPTVKRACGHYEIVDVDEARRQARHFRLYGEYPRGSSLLHERGVKGGFHPVGIKNRHNLEATSPWVVGIGGGSDLEGMDLCKNCKIKLRREDAEAQAKLRRSQTEDGKIKEGQAARTAQSPTHDDDTTQSPKRYGSAFVRGTDTPKDDPKVDLNAPSLTAKLDNLASPEADNNSFPRVQPFNATRSDSDIQENDTGWRRHRERSDTDDSDHGFNPEPTRVNTDAQMIAKRGFLPYKVLEGDRTVKARAESWDAKIDDEDIRPLLREASQFEPLNDLRFFEKTSTPSAVGSPAAAEVFGDVHQELNGPSISIANDMGRLFDRILLEHRHMLGSVVENLKSSDSRLSLGSRLAQELSTARADILTNTWHVHLPPQRYDEDLVGSAEHEDRQAARALNDYTQSSITDILRIIDSAASDLGVDLHNASPVLKAHQHAPPLSSADGAGDMMSFVDGPSETISSLDGSSDGVRSRLDSADLATGDKTKLRSFWEQWSTGDPNGGIHLMTSVPQVSKKNGKEERTPTQFESFPAILSDSIHIPTVLSPILSAAEISRPGSVTPKPFESAEVTSQAISVGGIGDLFNAIQETGSQIVHAVVDAEERAVDYRKASLPPTEARIGNDVEPGNRPSSTPVVNESLDSMSIIDPDKASVGTIHVPLPHTIRPVAHRYDDTFAVKTVRDVAENTPTPPHTPIQPRIENVVPMSPPSPVHAHRYGNSGAGNAYSKSASQPITTPLLTPKAAKAVDPFLYRSDSVRGVFSSRQLSRSELSLLDIHIPRSPKRPRSEDVSDLSRVSKTEGQQTRRASVNVPYSMFMKQPAGLDTPGPDMSTPPPTTWDQERRSLGGTIDNTGTSSSGLNSNEFTMNTPSNPSNNFTDAARYQIPPPIPAPPVTERGVETKSRPQGFLAPSVRRQSTMKDNINTMYTQPAQSIPTPARRRSSGTSAQPPTAPSRTPTSSTSPAPQEVSARLLDSPVPTRRSTVRQSISSLNAVDQSTDPTDPQRRRSSAGVPSTPERKPTFKPAGPAPKQKKEKVMHAGPSRVSTLPKPVPAIAKDKDDNTPAGGSTGTVNPNPRYPAGGVSTRKGRFEAPGLGGANAKADIRAKEKGQWRQSGLEAKKAIQGRAVGVLGMKGRFE
ncbi:hypothetical protein EJ05DRAFT_69662 [Pseudovirgaria hyperparasitica]|uniref:Uncharacterized protein n=1 Tax=Pseudovirgaria hyperparasitica TaxID=470096 RepID=A0A6A6W106_9PEZI|nr:uncharacterized protein EJ05DRAFT_69662 [Pseudovirgaria hyperparasitica]KAF2756582.1 hypothetical protein EJ05DRAFT_69662 [Pseudovirgaria hyperparasitica]